jgi:hypothetical protein
MRKIYFTETIGTDDDLITITRYDFKTPTFSFSYNEKNYFWDNSSYLINKLYPMLKSFSENKTILNNLEIELISLSEDFKCTTFEILDFFFQNGVLEMFNKAIELDWFKKENNG